MKNYLDQWIVEKIGMKDELLVESFKVRKKLEEYQLEKLKETIAYAKEKSIFYKNHLAGMEINSIEDLKTFPFTDSSNCNENMLCVSQGQVSRIVTLDTSGSTGNPKRIFFTEEDQELTIDFFHRGMENLIDSTDTLLILMPTKTPGSIGDLLRKGVERMGARVVPKGPLSQEETYEELQDLIKSEKVTSIVATPTQIRLLAQSVMADGNGRRNFDGENIAVEDYSVGNSTLREKEDSFSKKIKLRTILLSAEYVPDQVVTLAEKTFGCKVFEHYGMTEFGLGGAVSCYCLEGYHPREADIYYEIIDPNSGEAVEDGTWGEVVFTTLTRKAMPFIRYRTGDISRWIKEPCPCGSYLKRLDKVQDRNIKKGEKFYVE